MSFLKIKKIATVICWYGRNLETEMGRKAVTETVGWETRGGGRVGLTGNMLS